MGGFGSGRHGHHTSVESCLSLDAARWMRERLLREGIVHSGSWRWTYSDGESSSIGYTVDTRHLEAGILRLQYTLRKSREQFDYPVRLQTTRPQFGGLRWWFTCPLFLAGRPCGRRVQKLFLPPRGNYFGCRHCFNLIYQSQREDAKNRALTKAQNIRVRLGGDASLAALFAAKPKGMWNRTYERLKARAVDSEIRSMELMDEYLERTLLRCRGK